MALVRSTISQIDNLATNFTENRISDHSTGKIIFISNFFILLHLCVSPFFVPWSFSTIHLFITINLQFSFVMYNNNVDSINAKTNRAMANVRTKERATACDSNLPYSALKSRWDGISCSIFTTHKWHFALTVVDFDFGRRHVVSCTNDSHYSNINDQWISSQLAIPVINIKLYKAIKYPLWE